MIPYSRQQITEDDIRAVEAVLRSDRITQGPTVERFEDALAEYVGAKYAVAVSNGTLALELAYGVALGGRQGHIVTSPLTFVATANAAFWMGRTVGLVGFVDVDQATGNMAHAPLGCDVLAPVHYAGRACPLPSLAPDPPPIVIEDACHALGAWDFDGCSRVGSCAHSLATVFSFHAVKPITTAEGGAITTNHEAYARELRSLRDHGRENGLMVRLGTNGRMSELQAALGLSQLKRCDEMRERRCWLSAQYETLLPESGLDLWWVSNAVEVSERYVRCRHAHHLFPVRIKNGKRDHVKARLSAAGIGAQVHYSPPVHLHPYYRERFGYEPGCFPNAEAWAAEELSLPLHAGMTDDDVRTVVEALAEALKGAV